jgi:putative addiction module killer protein
MELKIDYGPGWRIYYKQVGNEVVILLTGGTKNRQQQDIEAAKELARKIGR